MDLIHNDPQTPPVAFHSVPFLGQYLGGNIIGGTCYTIVTLICNPFIFWGMKDYIIICGIIRFVVIKM